MDSLLKFNTFSTVLKPIRYSELTTAVILLLSIMASPLLCAQAHSDEQLNRLKAAFILNFIKFSEWPKESFENDKSPFIVCIADHKRFGKNAIISLHGKVVKGRQIHIHRCKENENHIPHLLYFNTDSSERRHTCTGDKHRAILTIGDHPLFVESGGIIEFKLVRNKLKFSANKQAAENAGLKLSSHLLELASTN